MNDAPILSDDDPYSMPSMPTMHGGDPAALGHIDHYDLLRKLGGGGFGVVYLARDTASGVEVAIKTLHPLIKRNAEEMDLLREKFALVSRLAHPNIATALVLHPVRDIHVWDDAARAELKLSPGDSVMVMRYAPGVTLSKWRRQFPDGVVPPDLALEIGRQVAAALDYAHGERIVHRDIKPANIMVETLEGGHVRVRILDFGLAAEIRSSMSRVSTESGDTSGTRPYMAPEQWLGKKQDGRTDEYALACVLYELLSGAPPFAGVFETGDPIIMMATVKGEAPDEIEDVAPAVNAAILHALAKAPKDRFPSCAAFVAALTSTTELTEETEGEDEATSRPPSASGRAHSPSAQQDSDALEAAAFKRKVYLVRSLESIPAEIRNEERAAAFIVDIETELATADEALKLDKFQAAVRCLDRAMASMEKLNAAISERKRSTSSSSSRTNADISREPEDWLKERKSDIQDEQKHRLRLEKTLQINKHRTAVFPAHPSPGDLATLEILPGCLFQFSWCPATTSDEWKSLSGGKDYFVMGSPDDEASRNEDESLHRVVLTNGFWMARTPVTQDQWISVMHENPSDGLDGKIALFGWGGTTSPQRPVESVSWNDCQAFLDAVNSLPEVKSAGVFLSLPTEAQWEYACRAGTNVEFSGTGRLDDMGWFVSNSGGQTRPVGQKRSNHWGLFDMHGNVYEWCQDRYGPYPVGTSTNPTGPKTGTYRCARGGSAWDSEHVCGSARRLRDEPDHSSRDGGFRLVAVLDNNRQI